MRTSKNTKVDPLFMGMEPVQDMKLWTDLYIKYFEYWWIFGICPFKLKICKKTGTCTIQRNSFQRVLFVINVILTLYGTTYWLYRVRIVPSNDISYFYTATVVGQEFAVICFFYAMWKNASFYEDLVSYLRYLNGHFSSSNSWLNNKRFLAMLCILTCINQIVYPISDLEQSEWNFYLAYTPKVNNLFFQVFVNLLNINENSPAIAVFSFIFKTILRLPLFMVKAAAESLILTTVVTMNSYVRNLESKLPKMNFYEGYAEYSKLRSLFKMMNKSLGITMCGTVFGRIPDIINTMPDLLQPKGIYSITNFVSYGFVPIFFLTYSSWLNSKIDILYDDWLFREKQVVQVNEVKFSFLLHQLNEEDALGFESFGIIKYSSGLFGGIAGLILTFSVVYIQFQQTGGK